MANGILILIPPIAIQTIASLYPDWQTHKQITGARSTTPYRIHKDWIRFFLNDDTSVNYICKDICTLTIMDLEAWMCTLVKKYQLTKKAYNNMSTIPRNIFKLALDRELIAKNNFESINVPKHLFRRETKPDSKFQVFTLPEQSLLIQAAIDQYTDHYLHNIYLMTVPLAFKTGLRLGELLALQWEDINEDTLYVHQSLTKDMDFNDGVWTSSAYRVDNRLKKNAAPRTVHLTPDTLKLLSYIKSHYIDQDTNPIFVFEKDGRLAAPGAIHNSWKRLCRKVDILPRSPHKARKSYVTSLFENDLPLEYIRGACGHLDERTTLHNYCFNQDSDDEIKSKLQIALDSKLQKAM